MERDALDFDLCADLDRAIRRRPEVSRGVERGIRHLHENLLTPWLKVALLEGMRLSRLRKNEVSMWVGSALPSWHWRRAAVTFGCSGSRSAAGLVEVAPQVLDLHPFELRHLGHVFGLDLQHHHTLVQDLVVLEIVQQGARHHVGIAGQEHRGARDARRRTTARHARQE